MTKHYTQKPPIPQTPRHSPYSFRKHKNRVSPKSQRSQNDSVPSKTTASHHFNPQIEMKSLKPVYKSATQSKQFALVLIQDLISSCQYDPSVYLFMLKMLARLSFQGLSDVGLKVALTVFHIGSKMFNSRGPKLSALLLWGGSRVTREQVIQCEESICKGLDFDWVLEQELSEDETRALCVEYEQEIFVLPN